MKMPGGDAAIVDRQKLTGYSLNPEHPRGKHKARVFQHWVSPLKTPTSYELRC
jgi:hypothetical protein